MSVDDEDGEITEGVRAFSRTLEQLAEGSANHEMSVELHRLVQICGDQAIETRQNTKGVLTLSINIEALPDGMVALSYDIKRKEPKPPRNGTPFWRTPGGNLTQENPRQQKLFPQAVGKPEAEVQEVKRSGA